MRYFNIDTADNLKSFNENLIWSFSGKGSYQNQQDRLIKNYIKYIEYSSEPENLPHVLLNMAGSIIAVGHNSDELLTILTTKATEMLGAEIVESYEALPEQQSLNYARNLITELNELLAEGKDAKIFNHAYLNHKNSDVIDGVSVYDLRASLAFEDTLFKFAAKFTDNIFMQFVASFAYQQNLDYKYYAKADEKAFKDSLKAKRDEIAIQTLTNLVGKPLSNAELEAEMVDFLGMLVRGEYSSEILLNKKSGHYYKLFRALEKFQPASAESAAEPTAEKSISSPATPPASAAASDSEGANSTASSAGSPQSQVIAKSRIEEPTKFSLADHKHALEVIAAFQAQLDALKIIATANAASIGKTSQARSKLSATQEQLRIQIEKNFYIQKTDKYDQETENAIHIFRINRQDREQKTQAEQLKFLHDHAKLRDIHLEQIAKDINEKTELNKANELVFGFFSSHLTSAKAIGGKYLESNIQSKAGMFLKAVGSLVPAPATSLFSALGNVANFLNRKHLEKEASKITSFFAKLDQIEQSADNYVAELVARIIHAEKATFAEFYLEASRTVAPYRKSAILGRKKLLSETELNEAIETKYAELAKDKTKEIILKITSAILSGKFVPSTEAKDADGNELSFMHQFAVAIYSGNLEPTAEDIAAFAESSAATPAIAEAAGFSDAESDAGAAAGSDLAYYKGAAAGGAAATIDGQPMLVAGGVATEADLH